METLCVLIVAIPVIAVVGRGSWVVGAMIGRELRGSNSLPREQLERCRNCREVSPHRSALSSLADDSPRGRDEFFDLQIMEQQLAVFQDAGSLRRRHLRSPAKHDSRA